jgi:putative ABC transport system permease protein
MLVLAVDPIDPPFRLPELIAAAPLLKLDDTALVDLKMQKGYGDIHVGTIAGLEDRAIRVAGTYRYGIGFASDAGLIVSDRTLSRLFAGYPLENVSIGLIKTDAGADVVAVTQRLRAQLPGDVRVLRRAELEAMDQHFFVEFKPIGLMFSSGVLLALVVGGVILYQVLASEVASQLHEFAALEAIGYSHAFAQRVVLAQAAMFAVTGFVVACLIACVLYAVTALATNLPMVMTWQRVFAVLMMSIGMCGVSGLLVLRKLAQVDPVELFQ